MYILVCVCVCVCVRVCVCVCLSKYRAGVQSAARVGVLGWFSPMVLQSQPAKSTSSTSDRLIYVWLCKQNDNEMKMNLNEWTFLLRSNFITQCD